MQLTNRVQMNSHSLCSFRSLTHCTHSDLLLTVLTQISHSMYLLSSDMLAWASSLMGSSVSLNENPTHRLAALRSNEEQHITQPQYTLLSPQHHPPSAPLMGCECVCHVLPVSDTVCMLCVPMFLLCIPVFVYVEECVLERMLLHVYWVFMLSAFVCAGSKQLVTHYTYEPACSCV